MCESLAVGAAASNFPGRELAYDAADRSFTGVEGSKAILSPTVKW